MSVYTLKDVSDLDGDAEAARSSALFFEADRSDTAAFSILDTDAKTDDILTKLIKAKAVADSKRAEAFRILNHARLQKKMRPRCCAKNTATPLVL